MTSIVTESTEHYGLIQRVTVAAFSDSDFGHNGEAELIDALRDSGDPILSLVAIEHDKVVGHILLSPATIQCTNRNITGMAIGPMSVLPSHQRQGIGSKLVEAAVEQLPSDRSFVVVVGHPAFYTRFGFVPAADFDLTHGFAGLPQDVLFVQMRKLVDRSSLHSGVVHYHPAFGPQHVE